jgi:cell division protein FtsL
MTIFKPKKKTYLNKAMFALGCFLLMFIGGWLYVQNLKVGVTHDLESLAAEFRDLKVENAEIKNKLFGFFTPEKVANIASERGLVKDNNPVFVYARN